MKSEVIDEGFSEFCNCIITHTLIFVIRDQLVCCAKVILMSYCERKLRKSFGNYFNEKLWGGSRYNKYILAGLSPCGYNLGVGQGWPLAMRQLMLRCILSRQRSFWHKAKLLSKRKGKLCTTPAFHMWNVLYPKVLKKWSSKMKVKETQMSLDTWNHKWFSRAGLT